MGPKECAKLQIQISGIRKHLKGARDDYMELHFALARARGDDELYKSLRSHIMNLGDEIWKEKKSLDAKEDLWDRECRE